MDLFKEVVSRGYRAYQDINARCNNPNDTGYALYGAKGIKVEFSKSDFMFWYVNNNKNISSIEELKEVTCGRIDHAKNYSLDNLSIQTKSENSRDSINRSKFYEGNRVAIYGIRQEAGYKIISWHTSMRKAMEHFEFNNTTAVSRCCRGLQKNFRGKYYFKYA